jgi:hypothetical protein
VPVVRIATNSCGLIASESGNPVLADNGTRGQTQLPRKSAGYDNGSALADPWTEPSPRQLDAEHSAITV